MDAKCTSRFAHLGKLLSCYHLLRPPSAPRARLALKSLRFFAQITTPFSLDTAQSRRVLALIERDDLAHAARAEPCAGPNELLPGAAAVGAEGAARLPRVRPPDDPNSL